VFTVALVGADGAGKTTVARSLERSAPFPSKYLYMGMSPLSSNRALPISRLVRYWRLRAYKKASEPQGHRQSQGASSPDLHHRQVKRGPIWEAARLLNRFAEALYRHLLAFGYRLRGYVVLYDRHYAFEAASGLLAYRSSKKRWRARLEYWLMNDLFPEPDLVIFLDAPAEVLYERKGEATLEFLERRRAVVLEQGKRTSNFYRVDASQPLDTVVAEVTQCILDFRAARERKTGDGRGRAALPDDEKSQGGAEGTDTEVVP
jgi:thymidylate kinase